MDDLPGLPKSHVLESNSQQPESMQEASTPSGSESTFTSSIFSTWSYFMTSSNSDKVSMETQNSMQFSNTNSTSIASASDLKSPTIQSKSPTKQNTSPKNIGAERSMAAKLFSSLASLLSTKQIEGSLKVIIMALPHQYYRDPSLDNSNIKHEHLNQYCIEIGQEDLKNLPQIIKTKLQPVQPPLNPQRMDGIIENGTNSLYPIIIEDNEDNMISSERIDAFLQEASQMGFQPERIRESLRLNEFHAERTISWLLEDQKNQDQSSCFLFDLIVKLILTCSNI